MTQMWTLGQAAARLQIEKEDLSRLCAAGRVPFVMAGGNRMVFPPVIEHFRQNKSKLQPPSAEIMPIAPPAATASSEAIDDNPNMLRDALGKFGYQSDSMTPRELSEAAQGLRKHGFRVFS